MSRISTGWFGIPGVNRSTKVHAVRDGKPVCGAQIGPRMVYQWCAPGFYWDYLECDHCKRLARQAKQAELERMKAA